MWRLLVNLKGVTTKDARTVPILPEQREKAKSQAIERLMQAVLLSTLYQGSLRIKADLTQHALFGEMALGNTS